MGGWDFCRLVQPPGDFGVLRSTPFHHCCAAPTNHRDMRGRGHHKRARMARRDPPSRSTRRGSSCGHQGATQSVAYPWRSAAVCCRIIHCLSTTSHTPSISLWNYSENSLGLPCKPVIIPRLTLSISSNLGGIDEDILVQRHDVRCAQFAILIGLIWRV